MKNKTDMAAEALGCPEVASVWRQSLVILSEIDKMKPLLSSCALQGLLSCDVDILEQMHDMGEGIRVASATLLQCGYRKLPPDVK